MSKALLGALCGALVAVMADRALWRAEIEGPLLDEYRASLAYVEEQMRAEAGDRLAVCDRVFEEFDDFYAPPVFIEQDRP